MLRKLSNYFGVDLTGIEDWQGINVDVIRARGGFFNAKPDNCNRKLYVLEEGYINITLTPEDWLFIVERTNVHLFDSHICRFGFAMRKRELSDRLEEIMDSYKSRPWGVPSQNIYNIVIGRDNVYLTSTDYDFYSVLVDVSSLLQEYPLEYRQGDAHIVNFDSGYEYQFYPYSTPYLNITFNQDLAIAKVESSSEPNNRVHHGYVTISLSVRDWQLLLRTRELSNLISVCTEDSIDNTVLYFIENLRARY